MSSHHRTTAAQRSKDRHAERIGIYELARHRAESTMRMGLMTPDQYDIWQSFVSRMSKLQGQHFARVGTWLTRSLPWTEPISIYELHFSLIAEGNIVQEFAETLKQIEDGTLNTGSLLTNIPEDGNIFPEQSETAIGESSTSCNTGNAGLSASTSTSGNAGLSATSEEKPLSPNCSVQEFNTILDERNPPVELRYDSRTLITTTHSQRQHLVGIRYSGFCDETAATVLYRTENEFEFVRMLRHPDQYIPDSFVDFRCTIPTLENFGQGIFSILQQTMDTLFERHGYIPDSAFVLSNSSLTFDSPGVKNQVYPHRDLLRFEELGRFERRSSFYRQVKIDVVPYHAQPPRRPFSLFIYVRGNLFYLYIT